MGRITNDEMAEMIAERNGNQHYCKDCDDCCQPYDSTDDCFKSALQAMEWKDKQHKQEKQQLIDKAAEWLRMTMDFFNNGEFNTEKFVNDFKQAMKGE
jgi:hypothetical protein